MIRSISTRLALAAVLALGIPAATVAQEATLEGTDWHLTRYYDGDDAVAAPWDADATLRLDDGEALGMAACNGFFGSYTLNDQLLTLKALGQTQMACTEPYRTVEDSYLAALPLVKRWNIAPGHSDLMTLYLSDADDDTLLEFARATPRLTGPDISLLASELVELRSELDSNAERIDNIRIGALRDRIKALEAQVAALSAEPADPDALNPSEQVLLEAIPASIAESCAPRRSDNPTGTVAALQCKPDDPVVRDMAYYLMESDRAFKTWRQRMRENSVTDGSSCWQGRAGLSVATGALDTAGCYLDGNGRANLRYSTAATVCRQLDAGDVHLKKPALYIAVLGEDDDIGTLTRWAEPREWAGAQDLHVPIDRPEARWSNACPR